MNVLVFVGESEGIPVFGTETDDRIAMFADAQSAFLYVIGRQLLHRQLRNVYVMDMNDPSSPPEWWNDFAEHMLPRKFWPLVRPIPPPPPGTPTMESGSLAPVTPQAGGKDWVTPKTRREAGYPFIVREQPSEEGGSVLLVERNNEPLGQFLDDPDWTEAMTYIAGRQILTDSAGGVWLQPYGYPTPYPFVGFEATYMPYDLVETMRAIPQLGA